MKRRIGFCVLMALALLVRAYQFGQVPGGFNQDEAMAAYDAYALSLYGTDRFGMVMPVHFTAWGYGQMSVLLSYTMVPFIKLFGLSVWTARMPMLVVSMLALYVLYAFVRQAFNPKAALITLAFAAINPWQIMQARWALDCNMFPHFLLFGFFLLYKGLQNQKRGYLYAAMTAFALCMYAYGIAFYTVPLILLILCTYLLKGKHISVPHAILCFLVYMFFAWPIFMLMLINFFKWPSFNGLFFTIPFFPDSVRVHDLLPFSPDIPAQLIQNVSALFNLVGLQRDSLPWNMIPDYGIIYQISLPFTLGGLIVCVNAFKKEDHSRLASVFMVCWLGVALLSGLLVNQVNLNRANIIVYPLIYLTGLGIWKSVSLLTGESYKRAWISALITAYTILFVTFSHTYFKEHHENLSGYFFADFYRALDFLSETDAEEWYITAWSQYPGAAHVTEIMTLFGAQIDPVLFQDKVAYGHSYHYPVFNATPEMAHDGRKQGYLYNAWERFYFDDERFELTDFGAFGTAVEIQP